MRSSRSRSGERAGDRASVVVLVVFVLTVDARSVGVNRPSPASAFCVDADTGGSHQNTHLGVGHTFEIRDSPEQQAHQIVVPLFFTQGAPTNEPALRAHRRRRRRRLALAVAEISSGRIPSERGSASGFARGIRARDDRRLIRLGSVRFD